MKKKKDEVTIRSSAAEYLTYVASVGDQQDSIEMRYEDENIWLTQKMMATLYDVDIRTINEHIKKIYSRQVPRDTKHYNLQMIIAVGFKVNNERAVQFRKWANGILDLAEDRAERHIPMTMEDWVKRLDLFLMADDREVLQDAGKITAEIAKAKAETEFEKYRVIQDRLFMSDFDKYMLELEEKAKK